MNSFKPGQTVMITLESSEFYKRKGIVVTATASQVKIKVDDTEYWYWDDEAVIVKDADKSMTKQVRDYFDIAMREKERADAAEAREKKLREAIEWAIKQDEPYRAIDNLEHILASLYPKEEEAK